MKFKKALAVGVAALLVAGLTVGLTACKDDGEDNGDTAVSDYNFAVDGNKVTLRWDKYEGATGYSVEKSSTRHGAYEYLGYVESNVNEYVADDINSYYKITAYTVSGDTAVVGIYSQETALFGKNTYIYSPADDPAKIKEELDAFYQKTDGTKEGAQGRARGEFTEERLAAFFKAGDYDININMGYYTALAGLGVSPDDVTITQVNTDAHISLCNFWRTAENLTVNGNMRWAVSQATSLRRVHVKGDLNLSSIVGDYTTSGGFIADTKVDGKVNYGSQQQWLSRNSSFGEWSGCVWNTAFVGVEGNLPADSWTGANNNYTNIENSGTIKEKPYLTYDETNGYRVFVPSTMNGVHGISWGEPYSGNYLPLDKFYIARSDRDTAATINAELAKGKNLILTAGVYELEAPLNIDHGGTVVLGLGLATLRPTDENTDTLMRIADTENISVGGLLFDAGKSTKTLLEVGEENGDKDHSATPTVLSDLFFRVGGAKEVNTSVDACVVINCNNVIGDNFWIWRADHWDGVGWDKNKADNGIIVNGDDATFYGLFVEHFQKYQTVWNGNGGTTYFYQSELPYDVPNAASWSPDGTVNGYASYFVAEGVTTHTAYSLGVYSYLRDAAVTLDNAIVCPQTAGMNFNHMVTVYLTGYANTGITHIVNGVGAAAVNDSKVQVLAKYTP